MARPSLTMPAKHFEYAFSSVCVAKHSGQLW
jgi:hypothetical protein